MHCHIISTFTLAPIPTAALEAIVTSIYKIVWGSRTAIAFDAFTLLIVQHSHFNLSEEYDSSLNLKLLES